MSTETRFSDYEKHYIVSCKGNVPVWDAAAKNPARYASRKPWLFEDRNMRILDFGCGWGDMLLTLWAAGYRNIEGIDMSPVLVEIANKAADGRARILCGDGLAHLKSNPAAYNIIIFAEVAEHFPPEAFREVLKLAHTALKPGGRVVIRTPNMGSLLASYPRYCDLTHVCGYTDSSLRYLLEQAGFANHRFVSGWEPDLHNWRPWRPLRNIEIGYFPNMILHRILYAIRGGNRPVTFKPTLEVYSEKPTGETK